MRRLYLELMKNALTRYGFGELWQPYSPRPDTWRHGVFRLARRLLDRRGLEVVSRFPFDPEARAEGRDWPPEADTMIGLRRLGNLEHCIRDVIEQGVPGDLIETGVWRGGACIYMRAMLESYGERDRTVWVADSFQGLPKPEERPGGGRRGRAVVGAFPRRAAGEGGRQLRPLRPAGRPGAVSARLVQRHSAHGTDRAVAVMRLDGDMYDSTMVALRSLYPKLSVGGYVIVDDYHAIRGCKQAVDDFRAELGITDELYQVDWTGRYWRRTS